MPSSENGPPEGTSSQMSGSSGDLVQARDISGGVHFHGASDRVGPVPAQLPGDVYSFVNRADDLELLNRLLCSPDDDPSHVAVCLLTGAPGIGKTSLAVHWAHRARGSFRDGQLYVNLRGYDWETPVDPFRTLSGFLIALGVAAGAVPADPGERSSLYRSLLSERQMLIVLDNAATVAQVRPLLPGVGRCRVLITSRGLLSGLATRDGARRVTLSLFSEADSVKLLRSATDPYRTGDRDQEVAELARLCARLPLALRIAAERAAARPRMTLSALIDDLRDESSLWAALTTEDSDDADAVRSVFAWSYRALPESIARLFRLLGLFPGADFSSRAAATLAGLHESTARRLMGYLVDSHLVEQIGEDRYQFHDLLRAFAADLAAQTDPPAEVASALAGLVEWYLRCASDLASTDPYAVGHKQVSLDPITRATPISGFTSYEQAVEWFHAERANLTMVVEYAAKAGLHAAAWRIPALLRSIYDRERAFDDWFATAATGLTAAVALSSDEGRLYLLGSLGRAHFSTNNMPEAESYYKELLALCRELGDVYNEAVAQNIMGLLEIKRHRMREALDCLRRCDDLCREHGFRELTVNPATNLAQAYLAFGRPAEALAMAEKAVEINRSVGSKQAEMYALLYLSEAQLELGRVADAEHSVALARDLSDASRSRAEAGIAMQYLGAVQLALDEGGASLESYQSAAAIARASGDRQREAMALSRAGVACRTLGRLSEAEDFHRSVLIAWRSLRDPWQTALTLAELARDLEEQGRPTQVLRALKDEALALIGSFGDPAAQRLREYLGSDGLTSTVE